jgi:cysteine-rich repeat protein
MTLIDNLFVDNHALSEGGGLFSTARALVINTVFRNNVAAASGGAVWGGGTLMCSRCQFLANESGTDGGAVEITYDGTMQIANSVIVGNRARRATIWNLGVLYVANSALVANVNELGDGVNDESAVIRSCAQSGYGDKSLALDVHNSVLWNNDVGEFGTDFYWSDLNSNQQIAIETSITTTPNGSTTESSGGGTLVTRIDVSDCISDAPRFLRDPEPGVAGWGDADDDFGDLRLRPDSPAVDAGDNGDMLQLESNAIDLAGNDRTVDIDGGGEVVDMGAYERPAPLCGDSTVDAGEDCDDGNDNNDDGCTACAVDDGFSCDGAPSICTKTIYVDAGATDGANDGSSWNDAYLHLQDALAAKAGKSYQFNILVADGTYHPDQGAQHVPGDRTATFDLPNGVALYGGYRRDNRERVLHSNATILSGDIGTQGVDTDNSFHVVTANGVDRSVVLDNFLVTGGHADGEGTFGAVGGGLRSIGSDMVIANTVFWDNFSEDSGGGLYNYNSKSLVINCSFFGNVSNWWGGGMHNSASPTVVVGSVFSGNEAQWGDDVGAFTQSDVRISSCTFGTSNSVYFGSSDLEIVNTVRGDNFIDADGPDNTSGTLDDNLRLAPGATSIGGGDTNLLEPDTYDLDGDGDTAEPIPHDRDGNPRVVDDVLDVGAYQTQ